MLNLSTRAYQVLRHGDVFHHLLAPVASGGPEWVLAQKAVHRGYSPTKKLRPSNAENCACHNRGFARPKPVARGTRLESSFV
jgi:hypothetical protein